MAISGAQHGGVWWGKYERSEERADLPSEEDLPRSSHRDSVDQDWILACVKLALCIKLVLSSTNGSSV